MSFSNVKEIQQIKIPNIDKIVHFGLYFALSFLWMWSLVKPQKANSFFKTAFIIFVLATFFGLFIELIQENYTATRSAELLDVVSNCTGALTGILISKLILK